LQIPGSHRYDPTMARRKGVPRGFSFPAPPELVLRFDAAHFHLTALGHHVPRQDLFTLVVAYGLRHAEQVIHEANLDPTSTPTTELELKLVGDLELDPQSSSPGELVVDTPELDPPASPDHSSSGDPSEPKDRLDQIVEQLDPHLSRPRTEEHQDDNQEKQINQAPGPGDQAPGDLDPDDNNEMRNSLLTDPPEVPFDPADPLARFRSVGEGKTREGEAVRRDLANLIARQ
jgi:hypothetical protein